MSDVFLVNFEVQVDAVQAEPKSWLLRRKFSIPFVPFANLQLGDSWETTIGGSDVIRWDGERFLIKRSNVRVGGNDAQSTITYYLNRGWVVVQ